MVRMRLPNGMFLAGVVGGAAAMAGLFWLATALIARSESTTELNQYDTMLVDGHKALKPQIVAGRTQSLYHPLPWVGTKVEVSCPTGLKALAGTTMTCTGERHDGSTIDIPVTVIRATDTHITWKFER
ncbi:DUF4333 domain-containing protein [Streptomyces fulvoviolaceus]|uniref:DUF4333 domain-containing protein n=1 Tax=Streptomyces fulvoviolaceus TaxID=285535 RepID=UPI0021BFFDF9|nr:DUF4333 domain-containing protein [Streptomyces fulvoviolaceus]MCT9075081.1 DUF4333 domain-containing protein [Streptomyces fulvoviolaceus]